MEQRAQDLIKHGGKLFSKRSPIMTLWQDIADNFYPERADFTVERSIGEEFASHLMSSLPVLVRRDLGNAFSSMLRPSSKDWFQIRQKREDQEDINSKTWLEYAAGVQRRAMYDRKAQFVRATKEGDHDFATFGQCALSVELNRTRDRLLYRCWHLRDMAWMENHEGVIDTVHRKWSPTVSQLMKYFPGKLHSKVIEKAKKDPGGTHKCQHVVIPSTDYKNGDKNWAAPFVSVALDIENQDIIEEVPIFGNSYVIPRWQTVSGSQYAYSPATVAALPDARLLQAMTLVLLEAGEKSTNPPMIATQEAIRSDVALYAGGITWADSAYDEKLGEVLRPLTIDRSGIPLGMDMQDRIQAMLTESFYLSKLTLPPAGGDMTAYEVSQRVQEYIRQSLPLFEPVEHEYNAAICESTFDLLMRNNAFGPVESIPQSLLGQDVQFVFESPLTDAGEREKAAIFQEAVTLISTAAEMEPSAGLNMDVHEALREAMSGIGVPAKWMASEEEVAEGIESLQQQQAQQAALEDISQASQVAEQAANAEMTAQAVNG